jgi:predicted dehydrogenase
VVEGGLGANLSARDDVDADFVVVATPTASHVSDLEWALARGLHVFLEKPLGATRADLNRARELIPASRVVMVGCNLRFTEGFRCVESHLADVGRLLSVDSTFGWYLPGWRPGQDYRRSYSASRALGGGVILDAIHEIDYVGALAGPVSGVAATWTNTGSLEIDVEDLAELTLRHESGVVSQIHLDYLQRTYTRSCRVVGSEATLHWDYASGSVELLTPSNSRSLLKDADRDENEMYVAELAHFVDAVATASPTANDLGTATAILEVALTALERGAS